MPQALSKPALLASPVTDSFGGKHKDAFRRSFLCHLPNTRQPGLVISVDTVFYGPEKSQPESTMIRHG
jgi:hypothetical protein